MAFQGGGRAAEGVPLTTSSDPSCQLHTPAASHSPGGLGSLTLGWGLGRAQGSPREDAAKPSESLLSLSLSLIWVVSRATLLASDSSEGSGTSGVGTQRQGHEVPGVAIPGLPALQGSIQLEAARVPTSI